VNCRSVSHLVLLTSTLVLVIVPGAFAQSPLADIPENIALVDGKLLSAESFQRVLMEGFAGRIVDQLIRMRVIWDEAQSLGIELTPEEVEQELEATKQRFGSEAAFQEFLREARLSIGFYRLQLKTDLLLEKITARRGAVSDEEVRGYYDKHRDRFISPARVHLFELITTEVEAAYTARQRISQGEEFTVVARKMSVAPTAAQGGDLGWLRAEEIENELMRATAFSLGPRQVSNPLQVAGNYHVLYAEEATPEVSRTLEEARADIETALREEKGLTREAVLAALLREAEIKVTWEKLSYLTEEYAQLKQIRVEVDGEPVILPQPPRLLDSGKMLVPAKALALALGADVRWKSDTATFSARKESSTVAFTDGKAVAQVNGQEVEVVAPRIEAGVLMVEPRPLVEGLGGSLRWDFLRYTLFVKSQAEESAEG